MFDWINRFTHSGLTAFISHSACFEHNMGEGHPEGPERLAAIKDQLISSKLIDLIQEIDSEEATDIQLSRVHPPRYLEYLRSIAPHVGTYRVDTDTAMNNGTLKAIRYSAGAVVKAVDMVMQEKTPNAFCSIRPPGHHAESEKAMGFCFVNNVAVGVMHAIAEYRLKRVLVVDFDVHHGNGTEEIFKDDDRVMLISSFQHPFFPYCGDKPIGSNPHIHNFPLKSGVTGDLFREMVMSQWLPHITQFEPELIFISAGFDGHLEDEMGNFGLVEADYIWITQHIMRQAQLYCRGKIVSVLEGGYDLSSLARSVVAHLKVLTGE